MAVVDAIGRCFDAVITARVRRPSEAARRRWRIDAQGLDWRIHVDDALVQAYPEQPFSVFGFQWWALSPIDAKPVGGVQKKGC